MPGLNPLLVRALAQREQFEHRRAFAQQANMARHAQLRSFAAPAPTRRGVSVSPLAAIPRNQPSGGGGGGGGMVARYQQAYDANRALYGATKPQAAGPSGFLGHLLGNPVSKAVMEGLNVIDLGRRTITSTVKELGDQLVDTLGGGGTGWDTEQWREQIKDRDFGVGSFLHTGNKWLDRGIGFTGDVLLDPTTYVLPGAGEVRSAAGRAVLASRLAEAGAAKGIEREALEELVGRAGRFGEARLSNAERELAGLGKRGLRFGTSGHNVRVGFTAPLQQAILAPGAALRGRLADTAAMRALRSVRNDERLLPYLERLAAGRGDISAVEAAAQYAATRDIATESGQFIGKFQRNVNRMAKAIKGRSDLFHEVEAGGRGIEAKALVDLKDAMFNEAKGKGISQLQARTNHMPHYYTPEWQDYVDKAKEAGTFKGKGAATPAASSRMYQRVFEPGETYTINGHTFTLDSATAQDITDKVWAAIPDLRGKKLIEDDPGVVLARLLEEHAADVGGKAWEDRMRRMGALVDADQLMREVPDIPATKEARDNFIAQARGDIAARRSESQVLRKEIADNLREAVKKAQEQAKEQVKTARAERKAAGENLVAISGRKGKGGLEGRLRGARAAQAAEQTRVGQEMRAKYAQLVDDLDAADAEVTRLQQLYANANSETSRATAHKAALTEAIGRRNQLVADIRTGLEAERTRGMIQPTVPTTFAAGPEGITPIHAGAAGALRTAGERFADDAAERTGRYYRAVGYARGASDVPEEALQRMASVTTGRDVMPQSQAERVLDTFAGRRADDIERTARRAIADAATGRPIKGFPYGDNLRAAAGRNLSAEQLVRDGVIPDEVLAVAPQRIRDAWAEGQTELDDMLRPYRKPEAQAAAAATSKGKEVSPLDAGLAWEDRNAVQADIDRLTREIDRMAQGSRLEPAPGGGTRVVPMKNTDRYRNFVRERDRLQDQLKQMKKAAPVSKEATETRKALQVALTKDPAIAAKVDDMNDLAEFMAKKYRAVAKGTPDSPSLDRLVVDDVLQRHLASVETRAKPINDALRDVRKESFRGRNMPKYTDEEVEKLANRQWRSARTRHESARRNWERFEDEELGRIEAVMGTGPMPPTALAPEEPTMDDAIAAFRHNQDPNIDSPQAMYETMLEDHAQRSFEHGRAQQDYLVRYNAWKQERDAALERARRKAIASGKRVPKRPPSKAEFLDEARRRLRAQQEYVPSMPEVKAEANVDKAMAGQFREMVGVYMDDVATARREKNILDADARKAGVVAPRATRGWGPRSIEEVAAPVRQMMTDPTVIAYHDKYGQWPPMVQDAVDAAVAKVRNNAGPEGAAAFEKQLRGTGGRFMPLEEWQKASQLPTAAPVSSGRVAEHRRTLAEQLGIGRGAEGELIGTDDLSLGMRMTDLRASARHRVDEAEREFMRNMARITGVKWDQPRQAITRIKGGRATKWMIDGADVEVNDIRRAISDASGIKLYELSDIQSPERMLKRWLKQEVMTPPEGLSGDELLNWHANAAAQEEAIDKMSEKKVMEALSDRVGKGKNRGGEPRLNLEHVRVNRDLTDAEAQAAYINGMADQAYRYIDQGQAERIQDLYQAMSPTARARLHDTLREKAAGLNRERMDIEQRLSRIDTIGRGRATTHDPIEMLIGDRSKGVLAPSDLGAVARRQQLGEGAVDIGRQTIEAMTESETARGQVGQLFNELALGRAIGPVEGRYAVREAALEQLPETFVRQGGFVEPGEAALRQPGMGVPTGREEQLAALREARTAERAPIAEPYLEAAQQMAAETGGNLDALERLRQMFNAPTREVERLAPGDVRKFERLAAAEQGTVNLGDVGGREARATAKADIAATQAERRRLAKAEEAFLGGRLRQADVERAGALAEHEQFGQATTAVGEAQADIQAAHQELLQQRLEELGGPEAITRGQQAQAAVGGWSEDDEVARIEARNRQPLQQELGGAVLRRNEAQAAVNTHRQAMSEVGEANRNQLQHLADTNDILSAATDRALQHSLDADEAITRAKELVTQFAKDAPKRNTAKGIDMTQSYIDWINETEKFLGSGAPQEAKDLVAAALKSVDPNGPAKQSLQGLDRKIGNGQRFIEAAKKGTAGLPEVMASVLDSGYQAYKSRFTGEELAMSKALDRQMAQIAEQLFNKRKPGAVGQALDAYTKFFKAYATATPAFHLRNAMAATFMNASDGVSVPNMVGGVRIWNAFRQDPQGQWWKTLPPRYQQVAQDVIKSVYGSGAGGQFSAQEIGRRAYGKTGHRFADFAAGNAWIRGSRRTGEDVEGAVRAGMALDSLLRPGVAGRTGTVDGAIQRINRIHFNYSETSKFDKQMSRFIPFWTFLSRNVPLQIQQQWTNPRAYQHYASLVRNLKDQDADQSVMPAWLQQAGGFMVSPNLALKPDIGATQLGADVERLLNPQQLAASLGPQWKVPAQLLANRDFFRQKPYSTNDYVPVQGELRLAQPLLSLLGLTEDLPGGGVAVERKYANSIRDLIPLFAQINRAGATSPEREGKAAQGVLGLLGVPIQQITDTDIANARKAKAAATTKKSSSDEARRRALARVAAER
jgi:hypothetical protein